MTHPIATNIETIDVSSDEWRGLSYYSMNKLSNKTHVSVMHFYQAFKVKNEAWIDLITDAKTGEEAEQVGNMAPLSFLASDEDKILYMKKAVEALVHRSVSFRVLLGETGTRRITYSNNVHQTFWGMCQCNECPWGANYYGMCLGEVRDRLLIRRN